MTEKLRCGTLNVTGNPGKTVVYTLQTTLRGNQSEGQEAATEQVLNGPDTLNSRKHRRAALTRRSPRPGSAGARGSLRMRHNTPVNEGKRNHAISGLMENTAVHVHAAMPKWVGPAYIAMALILLPWIFYLHFTLPLQQVAQHYRLAWVGFDVLEFGQLIRTGVYALVPRWRFRVRPHAAACAALLITDAWFDCTTTPTNQVASSIAMAVLVELPLAGICWWLALRGPHQQK